MGTKLEQKTRFVNIVIRKNYSLDIQKLKAYCEEYFETYAFIEHKGDISTETMKEEGIHYHLVGDLKERCRLSTTLTKLDKWFAFDNLFGIQIDKYSSFVGSVQYLLHKNDPDKTPHYQNEIITNIPQEELTTILNSEIGQGISADYLWSIIYQNVRYDQKANKVRVNRREIVKTLGINFVCQKRFVIEWALMDRQEELQEGIFQ